MSGSFISVCLLFLLCFRAHQETLLMCFYPHFHCLCQSCKPFSWCEIPYLSSHHVTEEWNNVLCLFFFLSSLSGCQWVFSQTARLARRRFSAGCQWKVSCAVCILLLSLFVLSYKHNLMFRCQWCKRQTTKPHGPTFLWHLCDRKKTWG